MWRWSLLLTYAAMALDTFATFVGLRQGYEEANPLVLLAVRAFGPPGIFLLFSLGCLGWYAGAVLLRRALSREAFGYLWLSLTTAATAIHFGEFLRWAFTLWRMT